MPQDLNGLVRIGRSTPRGYTEENLDFEQTWTDASDLVIKAYDADGNIVYIKIGTSLMMEELIASAPADLKPEEG